MAQSKVTREELLKMKVKSTQIFMLTNASKLQSVATTANQLKNKNLGEWTVAKDYDLVAVSVTRIK